MSGSIRQVGRRLDGVYRTTRALIIREYYFHPRRFFSIFLALVVAIGILAYWKPVSAQLGVSSKTQKNSQGSSASPKHSQLVKAEDLYPSPDSDFEYFRGDIRVVSANNPLTLSVTGHSDRQLKVEVKGATDWLATPADLGIKISQNLSAAKKIEITPKSPDLHKAGRYTITAQDPITGVALKQEDIGWGVIAFNPDYTIYEPGKTAKLAMAVLDDRGKTMCDASLTLEITDPADQKTVLSTKTGEILVNEACQVYGETTEPDFATDYQTGLPGDYRVRLIAEAGTGRRILEDLFSVKPGENFYLQRVGTTRTYPPIIYHYGLNFEAKKAGNYTLREEAPEEFEISNTDAVITVDNGRKILTWQFNAEKDETRVFSYDFKTPFVSPYLYTLGSAEVLRIENSKIESSWAEPRVWLIASDAACASNVTTGNWVDASSWTACGGVKPSNADTVTISANHTITLTTNEPASAGINSLTIASTGVLTEDSGSRTLTIDGTTGTQLTNSGTFTANTSTIVVNSAADLTILSGTWTGSSKFNNLTFTPVTPANNADWTMGTAFDVGGAWNNNPSSSSARDLNITLSGTTTVTGLTTLSGTGCTTTDTSAALTNLSTSVSNHAFSTGSIDIQANGEICILNINNSTFTVTGTSGTLFTKTGTFTIGGTSTTVFNGNGTATLTSNNAMTFDTLNLAPTISSSSKTYTFGTADLTINDDFTINPTASSALTLTVNLGGYTVVSPTGTTTIMGTTSATGKLDTVSGSNHTLETGLLIIGARGNLTAQNSNISLNATSGTLFTLNASGDFVAGGSTVIANPDSNVTLTSGTFTSSDAFNKIQTNPLLTGNRIFTFGSGAIEATLAGPDAISITSSGASAFTLTVNMGASWTVPNGGINFGGGGATSTVTDTRPSTTDYNITAQSINITLNGTLDAGGSSSIITLTGTSGTLFQRDGTFTQGTSTVSVTSGSGTPTFLSGATSFHVLTINAAATVVNMGSAVTINAVDNAQLNITAGVFNVDAANITGPGTGTGRTLTIGATGKLCLGGTTNSTSATCNNSATQTATRDMPSFNTYTFNATSTVSYLTDVAQTVDTTPTYGNLILNPIITAGRIYTFEGAATIDGNFDINPDAASALVLTVNMAGNITVAATKTTTITRTGANATSLLDLRPVATNYNLTTGYLSVATGGTLDAGGSASIITLTATSGTLFTRTGTFTQGISEVRATGAGNTTLLSATATFHKLTINPTSTNTVSAGAAITINNASGAALDIQSGKLNDGGNQIAGSGGTNGTLTVAASAELCLGGNTSCTTSSTTATTLPVFNAYSLNVTSTVTYLANAAQAIARGMTYGNLKLTPVLATSGKTYTFDSGAITVDGNFDINPDAGSALALSVNPAGNITVAASKTTTIQGSGAGPATASLDTRPSATDYNLTTGKINIAANGTLDAGGSASIITLTGTTSPLFTRVGTFTQGTSEVKVEPNDDGLTLLSATTTFHKLTINNAVVNSIVNAGAAITINDVSGAALTVTSGILGDGGNQITGPGGTNGTLTVGADGGLCVGASGVLDNCTTSSTTATTLPVFNAYSLNTDSDVWYSANAAQAIARGMTYGNLTFRPVITAGRIYTFDTGTVTVNGNFSVSPDAASTLALTVNMAGNITVASGKSTIISRIEPNATSLLDTRPATTDYNLTTGILNIDPGGTLDATSAASAFNISGNYINNGTFTAGSSTVTLNGTTTQTLSGTMTSGSAFYNLTISNNSGTDASDCERTGFAASVDFDAADATVTNNYVITTASVRVEYDTGNTYTFANINWNGQASGTRIYFRNSATTGTWLLNVSGTQTAVSYVNVSRSDASAGNQILSGDGTNVDCGNNTKWTFQPTYEQSAYRFGVAGSGTAIDYTGAPAQNTAYTVTSSGTAFRLRIEIHVGASNLALNGETFKLKFGEKTGATCASGVTWADVSDSSGAIRYSNGTPADGDNISLVTGDPDHNGAHTNNYQDYEEVNNFTNSVSAINTGEDGLWDFSLVNNSAVGGKRYCFRATKSNETTFETYTVYPEVIIDEELIFTLDATSKNFGVIQPGGNPTNVSSTLTTTTNSSTGYVVYAWSTQLMTMGASTLADWTGTNASPTTFGNGSFGFGYTTDDASLTGGTADRFTNGGAKYAGFVHSGSGDPVADRTTGPVSGAVDTITYRIAASGSQVSGTYTTIIVYVCSVTF